MPSADAPIGFEWCDACEGEGYELDDDCAYGRSNRQCLVCKGTGYLQVTREPVECQTCFGGGWVYSRPAPCGDTVPCPECEDRS